MIHALQEQELTRMPAEYCKWVTQKLCPKINLSMLTIIKYRTGKENI